MDRQKVFDAVRDHLLKQGRQAINPGGVTCLYRASDGCRCAVGCLIPDALYEPAMEGASVTTLVTYYPAVKAALGIEGANDVWFLGELQYIHDHGTPELWPAKLAAFADREGLRYAPAVP